VLAEVLSQFLSESVNEIGKDTKNGKRTPPGRIKMFSLCGQQT
jgi:hypothetical protein